MLAPFVGAFADATQTRRVMLLSSTRKSGGCLLMIASGMAANPPAKYGILTELPTTKNLAAATFALAMRFSAANARHADLGALMVG